MQRFSRGFLNVLSMEEVTARLTAFPHLEKLTGKAALSLYDDALLEGGHVLAEDIVALEDLPPADRAAMDGYAVRAADLFGASASNPVWLDCIGQVSIDQIPDFTVGPGQCAAIVTGGRLPRGSDAVIMVEYTSEFGAGVVEMRRSAAPGEHVLCKGEDAAKGETALAAGTLLRPQELGLLVGLGVVAVPVIRRPRVALLSTGDELVPPEQTPESGCIRDVNSVALAAMIRNAGCKAHCFGIVPDQLDELTRMLGKILAQEPAPDVLFLSGGSSVGVRDLTMDALASFKNTEIFCHGVALSPGKPLILARCGSTFIWGLPGQMTSAQVVMLTLGLPFLRHLAGWKNAFDQRLWRSQPAVLMRNVASRQGREDYVRVRLQFPESGEAGTLPTAVPLLGGGGVLRTLLQAHGVIRISARKEGLEAGTPVNVLLFK